MAGTRSVEESTKAHLQFKQMMEEVLLKIEPHVVSTKIPTPTGKNKRVSGEFSREAAANLKFTKLEVQDPKDQPENESPAESLVDVPEEMPDPPQLDEIYEAEPTIEDKLMEMSSVLDTLQELREHVQELWAQYQKREISLIVATITTNTAIDLARMKEDGFVAQFPDSEAWEKLTVELFPNEEQSWTKSMGAITPGDQGEMDRLYQLPTKALAAIRDLHETHGYPWMLAKMLPQINRVYGPRQDESKLTPPERMNRGKILLESLFPEFVIQMHENVHVTHDLVTAAFESMLRTKTVRLWMSFSFQILCDIHHVLGDEYKRPYMDFKGIAACFQHSADKYIGESEYPYYDEELNDKGETYGEYDVKAASYTNKPALEDLAMAKRMNKLDQYMPYLAHAQQPFFMLKHHAMMSGSLATSIAFCMHKEGLRLANNEHEATAVLYLYNALQQERCISTQQPYLAELERAYGVERLFFGGRSTNGNAYVNHYLMMLGVSIQTFAPKKGRRRPRDPIMRSTDQRNRDMERPIPIFEQLGKEYRYNGEAIKPQLSGIVALLPSNQATGKKADFFSHPVEFLTSYGQLLKAEEHRLRFDGYQALDVCWKLLKRIERSTWIQSQFRKKYPDEQRYLTYEYLPLFIFRENLKDLENKKLLRHVGELVVKFFRDEYPPEKLQDKILVEDTPDSTYSPAWEIDEPWHPTKDGACYHIGVCELQVMHWRLQAGWAMSTSTTDAAINAKEASEVTKQADFETKYAQKKRQRGKREKKGAYLTNPDAVNNGDGHND